MDKKINVLVLEKRGCNFWKDDEEMKKYSNVGNYRVFAEGLQVEGQPLFADFSRGYKRRFIKDKNGNIKSHKDVHHHKLTIDTYWQKTQTLESGYNYITSFRCGGIEDKLHELDCDYTLENILRFVNQINDFQIEKIFIFDKFYQKIEYIAGFREKAILEYCWKIELIQNDGKYQVFRLYGKDGDYFDYENKSNRIVG